MVDCSDLFGDFMINDSYIYILYSFVDLFEAFSSLKTGDQIMFRPDLSVPPNKYYTLLNDESLVSKTAPQKMRSYILVRISIGDN